MKQSSGFYHRQAFFLLLLLKSRAAFRWAEPPALWVVVNSVRLHVVCVCGLKRLCQCHFMSSFMSWWLLLPQRLMERPWTVSLAQIKAVCPRPAKINTGFVHVRPRLHGTSLHIKRDAFVAFLLRDNGGKAFLCPHVWNRFRRRICDTGTPQTGKLWHHGPLYSCILWFLVKCPSMSPLKSTAVDYWAVFVLIIIIIIIFCEKINVPAFPLRSVKQLNLSRQLERSVFISSEISLILHAKLQ